MRNGCRIRSGSIKMKDKKIAALPVIKREGLASKLADSASDLIETLSADLAGYAIIAWDHMGTPFVSWRTNVDVVPAVLLPHFVGEAVRYEIYDYFNDEA